MIHRIYGRFDELVELEDAENAVKIGIRNMRFVRFAHIIERALVRNLIS